MLIGTLCQVIVVPGLFYIFQSLQEKLSPIKFEDEVNSEVSYDLKKYAKRRYGNKK